VKLPAASTLAATMLGIGYAPVASGTVASAVAVPFAVMIAQAAGAAGLLIASLLAFGVGVVACGAHVRATGNADPSECVIDELAGQWLACAGVAFGTLSLPAFLLAFLLFRLFDIWKPWPVSWADTQLEGGLGVMADDMIAGLMAGVLAGAAHHADLFHVF